MQIRSFTFNPFETNCYVVSSDGRAAIVDPSCAAQEEVRRLESAIRDADLSVDRILLTHAHIDHIFGCRVLSERFGCGIEVHRDDEPLLANAREQARMFGIDFEEPPEPSGYLSPGNSITVGDETLAILHTPGHSPGSVTLYHGASGTALVGDVLFRGSIGRTDLWRGSMPVLMESIFQVLVPLGEKTRILPGHGPETTIGEELRSNPFLSSGA